MDVYDVKIHKSFPKLASAGYRITSPPTPSYNCIAWAAGDNKRHWWPDRQYLSYWPSSVPREETLEAFIKLFEDLGYEQCSNGTFEKDFEKVIIYTDGKGIPTHAARQLHSGMWTSKLGNSKDLEHTLVGLDSVLYGQVKIFLKRKNHEVVQKEKKKLSKYK